MLSRLRARVTYANVVSSIALFAVLGGGAYATHTHRIGSKDLRANAVTTKKIRNGAVGPAKLRNGAVRTPKIADGAVTAGKFDPAAATELRGPQGPPGPAGAQGPPGPPGPSPITGEGDLTAVPAQTILSVPAIGLEVRTDGDPGDDMVVELHNTGAESIGHQFPGQGNVSVILPAGFEAVAAPGAFADSGSDAERLDAVVFRGPDRFWIECLFPIDDALCRATAFP